ncbi:MAG: TRAP transporter small permease [Alphaproteobacteria bacterium]
MPNISRLMLRLEWAAEKSSLVLAYISVASVLVMTSVVTFGVVMRYAFNLAQDWTDQIAGYSLLFMVFLGLSYTLSTGGHIRVDFIVGLLSEKRQRQIELVVNVLGVFFSALVFLGCLATVLNFVKRGTVSIEGLEIPLYLPASALAIGSASLFLAMVVRTARHIISEWPPK